MHKTKNTITISCLFAVLGCRQSTFIADYIPIDAHTDVDSLSDADSNSASDSPLDSASVPDFPSDSDATTDSDTTSDSESATDSGTDSAYRPPDCSGFQVTPGDFDRSIAVDGVERSYVLHIPEAYQGPAALILDYHSLRQNGRYQLGASIFPKVTDAQGVVMAFPDGVAGDIGEAWNFGPCCVDTADDLAFTMAMIDDIKQIACIDPLRIYAAGLYSGGGFSYYLACQSADVFAAVSASAFDLAEQTIVDCTPSRPVTVVSFRSTADTVMPWEGGPGSFSDEPLDFLGAERTFDKWAELNGCTGQPSVDGNGCQYATECNEGAEVLLCKSTGPDVRGDGEIAWSILKQHTLPL